MGDHVVCEASRGVGTHACGCKRDRLWLRSPHGGMVYKLLQFHFLRYGGNEAKRGVVFRHSTHIA